MIRSRRMRWIAWLGLAWAAAISSGPAQAGRNREFRMNDLESALRGKLEGVSAAQDGTLSPSPRQEVFLEGDVPFVWALAPDGEGGVYAATGSEGRVMRVRRDGTTTEVAKTLEYELFAVVRGQRGELYVSGAPNGTISRVAPDGTVTTLVDLPEGLVWDMLVSPAGALFAATGESGEVYRIEADGRTRPVGRIPDTHVVSLTWWQDRLLCGTDGRGLLAALDPESGAVEILYDTGQEEVAAVLPLADGRVLFSANGQRPAVTSEAGTMSLPPIEVRASGGSRAPDGPRLYERTTAGLIREVWDCPEEEILCLAMAPDGEILAGTGGAGVLFSLDAQWEARRLVDLEGAQVLGLLVDGQSVYAGLGNTGAVVQLDYRGPREGTYTSKVEDADLVSRWGTPAWSQSGQGQLAMETRSGQLADPGETWSAWEPLREGRVASPAARFLQWRMKLQAAAGQGLAIRDVRVPYRGPNRAPQIAGIAVGSASADLLSTGTRPTSVRQTLPGGVQVDYTLDSTPSAESTPQSRVGVWARSLRSATWRATDPDQDELRFDLYLRQVGDKEFLTLKKDLADVAFTWDAAAWPEGQYELKLVARDEEGQVPGEGLTTERVSAPFLIDNTPPRLIDLALEQRGDRLIVTGRAEDALSRIGAIEYSLNGEGWRPALPEDGILDGRVEMLRFEVPALPEGGKPSVVGVRVADEIGHVASGRLEVAEAR